MVAYDRWPEGAPQTGMTFFRPGEVVVLMEPTSRLDGDVEEVPVRRESIQGALTSFFSAIGYPLRSEAFESSRDHDPLHVPRRTDDQSRTRSLILQTVTLDSAPPANTLNTARLAQGMTDVGRAVDIINSGRFPPVARKFLDDAGLQVAAATPNWLAVPFNW